MAEAAVPERARTIVTRVLVGPSGPEIRDHVVEVAWDPRECVVRISIDGEDAGTCCWQDPAWFVNAGDAAGPLATHVSLGSAKANPAFRRDLLVCCARAVARSLGGDEEPEVELL